MFEWLSQMLSALTGQPVVQVLLAILGTFILEDPTTILCGLLVAEGHMSFFTALVAVAIGIAAGDVGLYLLGRVLGPHSIRWGLVREDHLRLGRHWFRRKRTLITTLLVSRCIPGTRGPTFVLAGMSGAPATRFVSVVVLASVGWTLVLLTLAVRLGQVILPLLGSLKWPVGLALLSALVVTHLRSSSKARSGEPASGRTSSYFEFWPPILFYAPVAFYCLWLSVRYRGLTLPTAANPRIFAGGMVGETKSEIFALIPPQHRHWVARYKLFVRPPSTSAPEAVLAEAKRALAEAGLAFPIVAKPDRGQRGAGVRPIHDDAELRRYLERFPANHGIIFQELITLPFEAGVLYYRMPHEADGHIFSITLKEFPAVVGDGRRTVRELLAADPRSRKIRVFRRRHAEQLDRILAEGERLPLVFSGNHCQGTVFKDGTHLATPALLERIHELATAMPDFFFGRFDIRFSSLDALLAGEGFVILEVNGAGAEAIHIWDAHKRLRDAYRVLFRQFRILYEIGAENRRRGARPLGLMRLLRTFFSYRFLARQYPETL